ncbi:MAG: hypothetical protein ACXVUL_20845 [Solirubrobacteraceae bacterium]
MHDGTREASPELIAAIDAGDEHEIDRLTACALDRESGPGTGQLYLRALDLIDRVEHLHHLYGRVVHRTVAERVKSGKPLGFPLRVVRTDGSEAVRP